MKQIGGYNIRDVVPDIFEQNDYCRKICFCAATKTRIARAVESNSLSDRFDQMLSIPVLIIPEEHVFFLKYALS